MKNTITSGVERAQQIIDETANTIIEHARTDQNPASLLTKPKEEYMACLRINRDSLDNLLRGDSESWA